MLLDFAKAFDTVPHRRLLKSFTIMVLEIIFLTAWIKAWLTNRTQCVLLNGESSESILVSSGVPQGSVLGSFMFLL